MATWPASEERLAQRTGQRSRRRPAASPADTLVTTGQRPLTPAVEIGDVWGDRWQDARPGCVHRRGPAAATKFFVNGEEPTRRIVTEGGYRIQGTLAHRIKVIDAGPPRSWVWKRLADVAKGDIVPVQLGTMVRRAAPRATSGARPGVLRQVTATVVVPTTWTPTWPNWWATSWATAACTPRGSVSVRGRHRPRRGRADSHPGKELFHLEPGSSVRGAGLPGGQPAVGASRALVARRPASRRTCPGVEHEGKGWTPRVPAAIRETNDADRLRGVPPWRCSRPTARWLEGVPSCLTSSRQVFAEDLRTLLLALGMPTTTRETVSGLGRARSCRSGCATSNTPSGYDETVGFMSAPQERAGRKSELEVRQSGQSRPDPSGRRAVWDEPSSRSGTSAAPLVQQGVVRRSRR